MKKIIITAFAFALVFSLCACCLNVPVQNNPVDYNGGSDSVNAAPEIMDTEPIEVEENGWIAGEYSGDTYESDYIGIGFALPEGWSFYSAKEIRQFNCVVMNANEANYEEALKNAPFFYDMLVADEDNGFINVFVVVEKDDALPSAPKDMRKYLLNRIPVVQDYLESSGYSGVNSWIDTVMIDDRKMDCIYSTYNFVGTPLYQCKLYFRCEDGVVARIPVVAESEEELQLHLDCIYLLS